MELGLELLQPGEQDLPHPGRVLDEPFLGDDLEVPRTADHVGQVAAPGRVDPAGQLEDVVLHLLDPARDHDAAHLQLLPEGHDVRLEAEVLMRPHRPRHTDAGLDLVDDEQSLVRVTALPERPEELSPEVVVAALALDRLDDQTGDLVRVVAEGTFDLLQRGRLGTLDGDRPGTIARAPPERGRPGPPRRP